MNPAPSPTHRRRIVLLLLITGWLGLPALSMAASPPEVGRHLLQAELPVNTDLLHADGDQLAAAVGRATLAHQSDAPAILRIALTRGLRKSAHGEGPLPCAWAKRIFSVSVAAAPTQASALLDLATELYPACASELAGAMRDYDQVSYDYKDRVIDDKTVVDDKNGPARNAANSSGPAGMQRVGSDPNSDPGSSPNFNPGNDPATAVQNPSDLSAHDIDGLGYSSYNGFGNGFGPGFPGSPGFTGSSPDGGIALPPAPVTAAVNS